MSNSNKDRPKFYFKGVFLPDGILYRMIDGEVNRTDLILLAIIHALAGKKGCFASNGYIGGVMKLRANKVSDAIQRLRKRGLIISKTRDGQRRMRVKWDGVPPTPPRGTPPTPPRGTPPTPPRGTISNTKKKNTKKKTPPTPSHSARSARESVPVSGEGVFVESMEMKTSPQIKGWVTRLYNTINHRTASSPDTRSWHKTFGLLLTRTVSGDADRVEFVLSWLEKYHASVEYPITDAVEFRKKFISPLEVWAKEGGPRKPMKSSGKSSSPAAKPDAPLDPEVKEILGKVLALREWHPRAKREMPQCVATSLANYREFQRRAIALRQAEEVHTKKIRGNTRDLALYYLLCSLRNEMWLGSVAELVVRWFARLSRKVDDWPDWSGSLGGREFSTDSQDFRDWGYGIAARAGGTRSWDKFMEEINGR